STDGGGPFLTARRASARPKIFGLLAGKLTIDQIEVDKPRLRAVLKDGKLQNLKLELPESKGGPPLKRLPFSVVSASDADVDLDIDGKHLHAREIDADVTSDESFEEGIALELAVRIGEARAQLVRKNKPIPGVDRPEFSVDEDVLCRLDARARIE